LIAVQLKAVLFYIGSTFMADRESAWTVKEQIVDYAYEQVPHWLFYAGLST
jgi:hypothetical protein